MGVIATEKAIADWVKRFKHHNNVALAASKRWEDRKAYLKEYIANNPQQYRDPKTIRDKMSDDWQLQDALDEWSWHTREAERLKVMLEAEVLLRQLESPVVSIDPSRFMGALNVG